MKSFDTISEKNALPRETVSSLPRPGLRLQPIPDSTIEDPDPDFPVRNDNLNQSRAVPHTQARRGLQPVPDSSILEPYSEGKTRPSAEEGFTIRPYQVQDSKGVESSRIEQIQLLDIWSQTMCGTYGSEHSLDPSHTVMLPGD